MKKIVFLAHDPGGYDAIYPVAQKFCKDDFAGKFYCVGPAAQLNQSYATEIDELQIQVKQLIAEDNLAGLVTGTSWGNHIEVEMIELCKKNHIKTISLLDYWANYAMRFQTAKGHFVYPDYYFVMDDIARNEAIADGVPANIVKVVGHPGLDKYVLSEKQRSKMPKQAVQVLFLSQPLSVLYGDTLGYTEEKVLHDIIQVCKKYNYHLHVKFHPKDKIEFQNKYADISVQGCLIDIMPRYNLIIGMSTMGLLHAVLMGIPALSYQPGLCKKDGCITNKLGITKLMNSYQDLENILSNFNQIEIQESKNTEYTWYDGRSTERVVAFIRKIIENYIA